MLPLFLPWKPYSGIRFLKLWIHVSFQHETEHNEKRKKQPAGGGGLLQSHKRQSWERMQLLRRKQKQPMEPHRSWRAALQTSPPCGVILHQAGWRSQLSKHVCTFSWLHCSAVTIQAEWKESNIKLYLKKKRSWKEGGGACGDELTVRHNALLLVDNACKPLPAAAVNIHKANFLVSFFGHACFSFQHHGIFGSLRSF